MTKGIFITATGTDIGKTYISALMAKKLVNTGINCGYYKPVLSGAEVVKGRLFAGDCEFVRKISGIKEKNLASYIFKQALSPHLASEIEKNPISLKKICNDFINLKEKFDYIVVEGAGGITCPLNLKDKVLLLSDVIKALNLDILVVASAELGTINSTLLTCEYAKQNGINVKGIILNNYDKNNFMHKDNLKQIEFLTGVKVVATVTKNATDIEDLSHLFKEV